MSPTQARSYRGSEVPAEAVTRCSAGDTVSPVAACSFTFPNPPAWRAVRPDLPNRGGPGDSMYARPAPEHPLHLGGFVHLDVSAACEHRAALGHGGDDGVAPALDAPPSVVPDELTVADFPKKGLPVSATESPSGAHCPEDDAGHQAWVVDHGQVRGAGRHGDVGLGLPGHGQARRAGWRGRRPREPAAPRGGVALLHSGRTKPSWRASRPIS